MLSTLARGLWPHRCVLCGMASGASMVCPGCTDELPVLAAACPVCALPTPGAECCPRCLKHPPAFARSVAAFAYASPVDLLVQDFKYHERSELADWFADRLFDRMPVDVDTLVAMPLHPTRLAQRGYNQAVELARRLAARSGLAFSPFAARRLFDTPAQRSLSWSQRRRNVRGAFAVDEDMAGRRVLLIDDVLTTGASLHELARALRARGASQVSTLVIARTPKLRARGS